MRYRWVVIGLALILFGLSIYGFTHITQSFFPPATRPQFMVDVFLPAGTHIRESEAFAESVEQYIHKQPGVTQSGRSRSDARR
jgi:multidrug efflux pump subunit AcrB